MSTAKGAAETELLMRWNRVHYGVLMRQADNRERR
jgi:hypothetical protein